MLISIYDRPVTNTSQKKQLTWNQFVKRVLKPPIKLPDNKAETKARLGDYFVRGLISGDGRKDKLLKECCLLILDIDTPIDGYPLPTPEEIANILNQTEIAYAVHSSATPGRCRIIFPTEVYKKENTDMLTWQAYQFCRSLGLKFQWAGENKVKSQPWFFPQTTNKKMHQAFANANGYLFNEAYVPEGIPPLNAPKAEPISKSTNGIKNQSWFIKEVKSGTLHEAALSYTGYLNETTTWSIEEILSHISLIVDTFANKKLKDRWHKWEMKGLEKWYREQDFVSGKTLANEGTSISQSLLKKPIKDIECLLDECFSLDKIKEKEFDPMKWVIPGMLPAGLIIAGGRPKVGKSLFCLDLINAVAKGEKVFGSIGTVQGQTLYVSLEDRQRRIHNRLHDLNMEASKNAFVLESCPNIDNGLEEVIRKAKSKFKDLALVIFDTMAHVIPPPKKGNDAYNYYSTKLNPLQHLANELNLSIIFIHHLKKGDEENIYDKLIGSVGLQTAADTLIIIDRKPNEEEGFFIVTSRDIGEKVYKMTFQNMKWSYDSEQSVASDNQNYILIGEILKDAFEGLGPKAIAEATGLNLNTVKTSLKRMVSQKLIKKDGRNYISN